MSYRNNNGYGAIFVFLFYAYFIVCWIVNLIKFINCDFDTPWKDEIVHGIGIFTVIGSGITAWF